MDFLVYWEVQTHGYDLILDTMQGTALSRVEWKSINLMKKLAQVQTDIIFLSKCKWMDIMPNGLKIQTNTATPLIHGYDPSPDTCLMKKSFSHAQINDTGRPLADISSSRLQVMILYATIWSYMSICYQVNLYCVSDKLLLVYAISTSKCCVLSGAIV
ncbi:hypothetical protein UY3_01438 [Chelonia mydas]|uniref:Uncharacterized protein n=1 Tax=Chelonia mydas TaxID=8469 RepID=M7BU41_CHEMY|nr:hypothetical protein UY3_01438 [Chelonia mydas]